MVNNLASISSAADSIWPAASAADLKKIGALTPQEDFWSFFRKEAAAKLISADLPYATHELWRQTKPELFDWRSLQNSAACQLSLKPLSAANSALPDGIELISDSAALKSHLKLFQRAASAKESDPSQTALLNLHASYCSSVALLRVAKGTQSSDPISIQSALPAQASAAPLLLIHLEQGARATFLEDLKLDIDGLYFPRIEIFVDDGAHLEFVSLQQLSAKATQYARHRLHCGRDAFARLTHLACGARAARVDLDCRFYQSGSRAELFAFYIADGKRHLDFHPVQDHLAPHCSRELFYKGVLKDRAHAVYYGYVKVADGAQKTDAYQANRNLLLSSEARADSIPNLNIKANDVRCSHGSSVGQVGVDELFYLMSRGLSLALAEKLLVEGFFEDLLTRLKNPSLQEFLAAAILERLENGRKDRIGN